MKAKLVVVGGEAKTPEVELKLPAILGRGREATLTLPHPLVSRQHCEIFESNGRLMVRDLGSLNGTFVANQRITESELDHGQLLTVGTVTFRAMHMDDGSAADTADITAEVADTATAPAAPVSDSGQVIPTAAPVGSASDTDQSDETVPAPEKTVEFQSPGPAADDSAPPMALPVDEPGEAAGASAETTGESGDDEDDLSSFFDSLK